MKIKIGNAPCSWGVIENVEGERSNYHTFLDEVSEAGYIGTELGDWGFMPTDPDLLAEELKQRNLELTGSWVNVYLSTDARYEESLQNCLRVAHQLAKVCPKGAYINLGDEVYEVPNRTKKAGRIQAEDYQDQEVRKTFMKNVDRICEVVEGETGVSVLFHHHVGTWIETLEEIDELMNESRVNLCLDTGHSTFGGDNPVRLLEQYYDRIGLLHLKDCNAKVAEASRKNEWDIFHSLSEGIFPELGAGNVDFESLLRILNQKDYSGWLIVEQDVIPGMGNPKESAISNLAYLRGLLSKFS